METKPAKSSPNMTSHKVDAFEAMLMREPLAAVLAFAVEKTETAKKAA